MPPNEMSRRKAMKHAAELFERNQELQAALDKLKRENLDRAYEAIPSDMQQAAADLGIPFPESAREGDGGQRVITFVRDLFGALTRAKETVIEARGTLAEVRRILGVQPDAPILEVVEALKRNHDAVVNSKSDANP